MKREEERKRRQDERNVRNVSMKPDSTSKDINQNVIKLNPEPSLDENKNHLLKDASVSNGVDTNNSTMSCPISKTNKDPIIKKLSPNLLKKVENPNESQRGNRSNSLPHSPGSVKKTNVSLGNVKDRAAVFQQGEIFWKNKR